MFKAAGSHRDLYIIKISVRRKAGGRGTFLENAYVLYGDIADSHSHGHRGLLENTGENRVNIMRLRK